MLIFLDLKTKPELAILKIVNSHYNFYFIKSHTNSYIVVKDKSLELKTKRGFMDNPLLYNEGKMI